jgi:CRP-like cAMP-binding protein
VSTILDLCRGIPKRTFEPGTILFAEGKKSGELCVLIEGEVEILKGEFQVNTVSDPGAIFGEMSILLNIPHTATVRARTRCHVHFVEDGGAFLRSNNEIAYDCLKILAQRLNGMTAYLADLNRYVRSV